MASRRVVRRFARVRWLGLALPVVLAASLVPSVTVAHAAGLAKGPVPVAVPGPGPVDRPVPVSARPDEAFAPDKRPAVVPLGVAAGGEPRVLSAE